MFEITQCVENDPFYSKLTDDHDIGDLSVKEASSLPNISLLSVILPSLLYDYNSSVQVSMFYLISSKIGGFTEEV